MFKVTPTGREKIDKVHGAPAGNVPAFAAGGELADSGVSAAALADATAGRAGRLVFDQATPAPVWTFAHGLNAYPPVTTVDSLRRVVYGDVSYPDADTVRVSFGSSFAGKIFI